MIDGKSAYRLTIKRIGAFGAVSLCIALTLLFHCTPGPTAADKTNYSITLTLDNSTNTTATFSGQPITLFCTFRDTVAFRNIGWHLGSGDMTRPVGDLSKIKTLQIPIFWKGMPLTKDSLGRYYDSIYISLAGENDRSNSACVFVTNIPPVIDSVIISRQRYGSGDTIHYITQAFDTFPTITIRIIAHDVNKNALASLWTGSGSSRITDIASSTNATYRLPGAGVTDTLALSLYDRQGGNEDKTIIITSVSNKNRPPMIDSILVADSVFSNTSASSLTFSAIVFDSLHFRVWARDSDNADSLQIRWTNKNTKQAVVRQKGQDITWICSSSACNDTLRSGSDKVMDTVTIVVRDNAAASVTKTVIITKTVVSSDHPPIIDSVQCNDSLFRADTEEYFYPAVGLDTLSILIFGRDPDSGDVLKDTAYSSGNTRVTRLSEMRYQFVCPDSTYSDTVTGVVSDRELEMSIKKIVIAVTKK
jgi:hypothetical protein